MKAYFFPAMIILAASVGQAQVAAGDRRGSLCGAVTDSLTLAPMRYVAVSLHANGKPVGGTLTDSAGGFHFGNLELQVYQLTFSAVGYKTGRSAFLSLSPEISSINLGTVAISPEITTLKTITIRGQRPLIEQRADGIVFHTESLSAGVDAADLLRRVPMLSVDANGGDFCCGAVPISGFLSMENLQRLTLLP